MGDLGGMVTVFVTLFVVMDPIGLLPLFIALTAGMTARQRKTVAVRACSIAAILLTVFGLAGEVLLKGIGITMPAFQIAGGLLLFLTALDMLFDRRAARRQNHAAGNEAGEAPTEAAVDPSVFPLAMPLIAGPGAMAAMILSVNDTSWQWQGVLAVHLVMLTVIVITFGLFMIATPLERALGRTGTMVVTRLLGMLLAALSVQFVLNGLARAGVFTAM